MTPRRDAARTLSLLTLSSLSLGAGCSGGAATDAPDLGSPIAPTVGADLDEKSARSLATGFALPKAFYDALTANGLTKANLNVPDPISFASDPNRLHWTDEVRKQADTAPQLAGMVAGDVAAALAHGDSDVTVRELLAAQGLYGNRVAYQLSRYDRAITVDVSQPAQALVAALKAFAERPQYEGDPAPAPPAFDAAAVTAQVATLSPAAQVAIAQCVLGLLGAADLRDQALTASGKMKLADWQTSLEAYYGGKSSNNLTTIVAAYKTANKMVQAMDYDLLSRAGQLTARSVESLRVALKAEPLRAGAGLSVTGALGRIAVSLAASNDTWTGADYFLLVDGGGDDLYHDDIAVNLDLYHPIAAVLDVAGSDKYVPATAWTLDNDGPPWDTGVGTGQAAGWFGVALLDDGGGDDTYQAGWYQAYGAWGVGVIVDHGGKDTYLGYSRSQGASDYGYGLLVDRGGANDRYETLHNSQGFGGTRGIGWLVDDGGDDSYLAVTALQVGDPQSVPYDQEGSNFSGAQGFGWGLRLLDSQFRSLFNASGGLGALFDLAGNDTYECAVMCQGWGYFYGTGLLWDAKGDDKYNTWHKYGMGGATHLSIGVLVDGQGKDLYHYPAGGIPTNGGSEGVGLGYDQGVGFHIDRGPEADVYQFDLDKMKWGEVMGISRFPGIGVFLNEAGDDEYHIPGQMGAYALGMTDMPGGRAPGSMAHSIGLFLDLGGTDVYDVKGSPAKNDGNWKQTQTTTNAKPADDPFDPALDHGYGFDGTSAWPAW